MVSKQETVSMFLTFMSEFLMSYWGRMCLDLMWKIGADNECGFMPGGEDSPLVLHLHDLTLSE